MGHLGGGLGRVVLVGRALVEQARVGREVVAGAEHHGQICHGAVPDVPCVRGARRRGGVGGGEAVGVVCWGVVGSM